MVTKILASVLVMVMMGGALTLGSNAIFTDSEVVGGNTFTTGNIDISTSPASAFVTFSGMMPGDVTTQALTVSNAGSGQLRYAITASATNADAKALKDQLVTTIKTVDVTTPGTPCDNFDGTQLYTGDLDGAAGVVVGSNTQGAQAGDRVLNASNNEVLCFRVSLPLSATNAVQSAATTATFTFDAEQTANN